LLIKEPASSDNEIVKGAGNALVVSEKGDAKLLEIGGTASAAVIEYVRTLRELALESVHGNRANADRLTAAQSGRALELMNQPKVRKSLPLKLSSAHVPPANYDPTLAVCIQPLEASVFLEQRIIAEPTPVVADLLDRMMAVAGQSLIFVRNFHGRTFQLNQNPSVSKGVLVTQQKIRNQNPASKAWFREDPTTMHREGKSEHVGMLFVELLERSFILGFVEDHRKLFRKFRVSRRVPINEIVRPRLLHS
jgi:hypothetical protein